MDTNSTFIDQNFIIKSKQFRLMAMLKQLLENDSTENYFHQDEFGAIFEIGFLSNLIRGFGYNMVRFILFLSILEEGRLYTLFCNI